MSAFRDAVAQATHSVFGLRLHPLCLGHWFLMDQYGCDSAREIQSQSIDDLLLSALICSQPPRVSERDLRRKFRLALFIRFWSFIARRSVWTVELREFELYIAHHRGYPAVDVPAGGREMGTPEHWRLAAMLMFGCGATWREAMETPWLVANCLWAAEGERKNSFSVTPSNFSDSIAAMAKESA